MSENLSKKISIFSLIFLVLLVVFMYGLSVGKSKKGPYSLIEQMYSATLSLIRYGAVVPANRMIEAEDYMSRKRYQVYQPDKVMPGYYAYMGYDGRQGGYRAWLTNDKGETIHTWDLTYERFDADGPLNGSDSPHAFKVLEDGSLIVSFDSGDVMARIDQCSNVMWTQASVYHHSLERAPDGSFWAWRGNNTAYGHYHYMTNFDADTGKTIRELGLIEDFITRDFETGALFGIRNDYPFREFDKSPKDKLRYDLFHPNDIDVLQPEIADKFPDFEAGDLLLSIRATNLVVVIDPDTKEVKWAQNGPWRSQHDPDFVADGTISIYNNNSYFGRSEIVKINPTTGEYSNDLENGDLFFYSKTQGKHQYLPNGNLLIVNPDEGRTLQVTSNGDKVFELNNISVFSEKHNEHMSNGIWFASDYFSAVPSCSN